MKKTDQLRIRTVKHLGLMLSVEPKELVGLARSLRKNEHRMYQSWSVQKPNGKERKITSPSDRLKNIQKRINSMLQRVEMPKAIHGGRRGCSSITNALPHQHANVLVQTDIKDFFPSISPRRIYRMFYEDQDCSPDVARLLTRLVTYSGSLPQGAPTSPIVAVLATRKLAERFVGLAESRGGKSTMYIDDATISGVKQPYVVREKMIQIVQSEGLVPHPAKTTVSLQEDDRVVTGVQVGNGIDAPRELTRKLKKAIKLIEKQDRGEQGSKAIRSAHGLVNHLRRLNKGAAKHYAKRLRRAELIQANKLDAVWLDHQMASN